MKTVSELRFRSQLHAACGNVITPAEMLEIIGKLNALVETVPDEDELMDMLDVEIRSRGYLGPSVGKISIFAVKQWRRMMRVEHQRRRLAT